MTATQTATENKGNKGKANGKTAEAAKGKPAEGTTETPAEVKPTQLGMQSAKPMQLVPLKLLIVNQEKNIRAPIDLAKPDVDIVNLAISLRKDGFLNPITVRKVGEKYEVIAGTRRALASQAFSGVDEEGRAFDFTAIDPVPTVVFEASDFDAEVKRRVENVVRVDLTPFELAKSVWELKDMSKAAGKEMSAVEIGRIIGYERATVANMLGWRKLISPLKKYLEKGLITSRQANMWYGKDADEQRVEAEAVKARLGGKEDDKDAAKKGRKGGKESSKGDDHRMIRKEKLDLLMRECEAASEVRIGNSFERFSPAQKQAVRSVLRFVRGMTDRYPISGHEEKGDSKAEAGE